LRAEETCYYRSEDTGRFEVVVVVDVYDALDHKRVYKPAFSEGKAVSMITEERGKYFEPRISDCFLDLLPEMRKIREEVRDGDSPERIRWCSVGRERFSFTLGWQIIRLNLNHGSSWTSW